MAYNPALEKLRQQAEQRLYQKRLQEKQAQEENLSMRSLFDPIFNIKGREALGGSNWFETTLKGYGELFNRNYLEWFRNPGQALINNLTTIGDTLDYAANLIKAPLIAMSKGEDVGERLADAYGFGDKGRISQNMSELRETIGAVPSGLIGGTTAGAMIGSSAGPIGALVGGGIGLVVGATAGISGQLGADFGNTISDMALEYIIDPANIAGAIKSVKAGANIAKAAGTSDDVAKLASEPTEESISALAKDGFKRSEDNFKAFAKGTKANIDATSSLDYIFYKGAVKANGSKNSINVFKRYKKQVMSSYYNNDFKSFNNALVDLGFYTEEGFSLGKAQQMFDILKKDANLSRGYKILGFFDEFDTSFSKKLLKATPMGLTTIGVKKSFTAIKKSATTRLLSKSLEISPELEVKNTTPEMFKKFDEAGIIYEQTNDMSNDDLISMYNNLLVKSNEYIASGDKASGAVLKSMAEKIVFKNDAVETSVKSVRSSLNHLISLFIKYRGDLDKVLNDEGARKAYNNITALLFFPIGKDVLLDYITNTGYNKQIAKYLKQFGSTSAEMAEYLVGDAHNGAHTIIADILGLFAKHDIESSPSKQYIKTLNELANKTFEHTQSLTDVEVELRNTIDRMQSELNEKYNKITKKTDDIKIKYNEALVKISDSDFDKSVEDLFGPFYSDQIGSARKLTQRAQRIRAIQNVNLEQFVMHSKMMDNDVKNTIEAINRSKDQRAIAVKVSDTTKTASKTLLSIYVKKAAESSAQLGKQEATKEIDQVKLAQFQKEIAVEVKKLLEKCNLPSDAINPSINMFNRSHDVAKVYSLLKFFRNKFNQDPKLFIKDAYANMDLQRKFIVKYKDLSKQYRLTFDNLANSDAINNISNYLQKFEETADINKYDLIKSAMNYLFYKTPVDKHISDNIVKQLDSIRDSFNIDDNCSNMLKELQKCVSFNIMSGGSFKAGISNLMNLFDMAFDITQPLDFRFSYLRAGLVLNGLNSSDNFKSLFSKNMSSSISADFINDMTNLLDQYYDIGNMLVRNDVVDKHQLEYINIFCNNIEYIVNRKWKQYSSYLYLRHIMHDSTTITDENFIEAFKDIIDTFEEVMKYEDTPVNNAIKNSVIKGLTDELFKGISNKVNPAHLLVPYKKISLANLNEQYLSSLFLDSGKNLDIYINNLTTAIKYLKILEYITKPLNNAGINKSINNTLKSIDYISNKIIKLQMDSFYNVFSGTMNTAMSNYFSWHLSNINKAINNGYFKNINNEYNIIYDELFNINDIINNNFIEYFKKLSIIKETELSKTINGVESKYSLKKKYASSLTDKYVSKSQFLKSVNAITLDSKVVKLITRDGVVDLPDDLDIDYAKAIVADIETVLMANNQKPLSEDIVQLSFTSSGGVRNYIVYNPSYITGTKSELLSESIVNGSKLKWYNPEGYAAFMSGKLNQASWVEDGVTYNIYKDTATAFDQIYKDLTPNIVNVNGKNYIFVIGQNSTKFDNPAILDGLNKYTDANLEGIISEDTLPFIRLFQGLAQYKSDDSGLLHALRDIPNAKLEDVYQALLNQGLVKDLSGIAHDASYDIKMTEQIMLALHKYVGYDNIKSIQSLKKYLYEQANGITFESYNKITELASNIQERINELLSITGTESEYLYRSLFRNTEYLASFNTTIDLINNPNILVNIYSDCVSFLDNALFEQLQEGVIDKFYFDELINYIEDLKTLLENVFAAKSAAMHGIYGDSLIEFKVNSSWAADYLIENYFYTRNDNTFLELYNIYSGENISTTPYSLSDIVQQYRNQFSSIDDFKNSINGMSEFYDYTERIDAFVQFSAELDNFFNDAINKIDIKNKEKADALRVSYSKIQDKLFGSSHKTEYLSLDGWFKRMLTEMRRGNIIDETGDIVAKNVPEYEISSEILADNLKRLIFAEGKLDSSAFFNDVIDDINSIDSSGKMYNLIIKYINDCINNISKYDIFHKSTENMTLLRPVPDRQYWDKFRTIYNNIISNYVDSKKGELTIEKIGSSGGFAEEGMSVITNELKDADDELSEFLREARAPLSELSSQNARCRAIGFVPEAYVNEMSGMNSWDFNRSMGDYTIKHSKRSTDYNLANKIKDKFYDIMGIKFDPNKPMDVMTYRNNESVIIKSIQELLEDSGIYINELDEIIRECSVKNRDYVLNKLNMYSKLYDELVEEPSFKKYIDFKENVFNGTFNYLPEDAQSNIELFNKYTNMYKSIAVLSYLKKVDNASVYDIIAKLNNDPKKINVFESAVAKSFKEFRDQTIGLFTKADGTVDYDGLYYYIQNNNDFEFVMLYKSDKYFKKTHKGKLVLDEAGNKIPLSEIQSINVDSPEQLKLLLNDKSKMFSIMDKHTIAAIKDKIGQVASNRVYKSNTLNILNEMRRWVSYYIMAPMKSLSLYNIGFTVTNLLEGMFKTFNSTTGSRLSTFKQYWYSIKMHKDWTNLTNEIAYATQGTMFYSLKDQLQLLYYEDIIGKTLFSNWENILKGEAPVFNDNIVDSLNKSELPKYIKDKLIKSYNNRTMDINKYAERFLRVHKVVEESLPKYNLDEYKITNNFINSPAAAAEFQSIKKSAELNLIGYDSSDNIVQQTLNKFFYSDKWMGENNPLRHISVYANLSRNSDIELINRFAMYLDLVEKGFANNESLNKVLATHFNYSNKSNLELALELLIPFISFPLRNFMYWSDALEKNPELLKAFIDMTICNWGDEINNPYNQTKVTKGGIRLWGDVSMETGISAYDAMMLGGNALNVMYQRKLNPLLSAGIEGAKQLVTGQSNLDYRLKRLPVISNVNAVLNLVTTLQKQKPQLYDIAPSMFNEVYKTNRFYYNNQGRYAYKSAYSRLYSATGYNRYNYKNKINAIRNVVTK